MITRYFWGLAVLLSLSTCRTDSDAIPIMSWSRGCIELTPENGGYRLHGMCCAYALMPNLDLMQGRSFSSPGTYHAFTGAGFSSLDITIQGQVSPNGQILTLTYTFPNTTTPNTYELTPGKAQVACLCGCD